MEKPTSTHSVKHHVIGFILSLIMTMAAYYIVSCHLFHGTTLAISLGILASAQAIIQLIFFLDLGNEPKPKWNLIHFIFMALILIIVVAGSLWIMHHLNYNMMHPDDMERYMRNHQGL